MKKILQFILLLLLILPNKVFGTEMAKIVEGSNNAKLKLVIYESLTCSHCADFHLNVYPELKKKFIDTGLASLEFRNFPLDLAALNASKLAHCKNDGNPNILHFLYKNQKSWIRGSNILEINNNLKTLIEEQKFQINMKKCLEDKNLENFILQERIDGVKKYEIQSTPTLIINEKKFDKRLNYKNLEKSLKKML